MSDQTPEQAAHAHARAIVSGDIGASVGAMTPDALAKAMAVGNTSWDYSSYELTPLGPDGDDYLFDVTYAGVFPFALRERFRNIDGHWKLVDIDSI